MQAIIDRIEDGKIAVINIIGGGKMSIPTKQFKFKIHEGMFLNIQFKPDKKAEEKQIKEIKSLQNELLNNGDGSIYQKKSAKT
ncbi:MAG: hypothetical protein A2474_06975 [Elusimicrobia bacterium RIFOXYC2_FULL_34_12]|nr:MAG: hypothetical protein A2474_06975 [Elusimicrobia bacterium RIFOXYC2_FULL_34_12]OGS37999.1 MAG: hypothetical protein A2551_04905 [Elusimicrobia bacterium RIFOXYD2_FULL_34_30]HAM38542.1 hypothetical protein [Elusimicrobiota bacterium]